LNQGNPWSDLGELCPTRYRQVDMVVTGTERRRATLLPVAEYI
jgi:hypothetical protein